MDKERFDNLYFYIEILNKFSDDIVEGYKFDLRQIYNGVESGRRVGRAPLYKFGWPTRNGQKLIAIYSISI